MDKIKEKIEELRDSRTQHLNKFIRERDVLEAIWKTKDTEMLEQIDFLRELLKESK